MLCLLSMLLVSVRLQAEQEVLLSSIKNYQPYSYQEDGEVKGLYNDIAREAFKRADIPLRIELISFHSVLRKVRIGFSHAMIGALYTHDRAAYAQFLSPPLSEISTSLFVHTGSQIEAASLEALKGKTIGIKQGFIMEKAFEDAANQGFFERYEVQAERQLILMLLKRRTDGFIHTTSRSLFHIDQLDKSNEIKRLEPPIVNRQPSFFALSRVSLEKLPITTLPRIEQALNTMRHDGTLADLHKKYSLPYSAPL